MDNNFTEFFSSFQYDFPPEMCSGKILKITSNNEHTALCVTASFSQLVTYDQIVDFCTFMKDKLSIRRFTVNCKFAPDMLTADYFTQIFKFFKDRFSLVNGFFYDAVAKISDGVVTIELKHGGYRLLKDNGASRELSALIEEMFSVRYKVEFNGLLENDSEKIRREQQEFLANLPPPEIPQRSDANNAPSASIPSNKKDEEKIEFRTCSVDFTRLHLLCENALVLKGSPISPNADVSERGNGMTTEDALEIQKYLLHSISKLS